MVARAPLLVPLLLLSCKGDYQLKDQTQQDTPQPSIRVEPDSLDFGLLADGEKSSQAFSVFNDGNSTLTLQNVSVEGSSAFIVTVPPDASVIGAGESAEVIVQYSPINREESATISILSNDPGQPEVWVALAGEGAYPELTLDPNPLILSIATPGDSVRGTIRLENTGTADLEIHNMALTGVEFTLEQAPTVPLVLAPGESAPVDISFTAADAGTFTGHLWVQDNTLAGGGSAELLGASAVPVALCDVTPDVVAPLHQEADWRGSESFDAAGHTLVEYRWALTDQPPGSAALMPGGAAVRDGFLPDMAGWYTAELVVVNDQGVESEACVAQLEAIPDQNLWVEMFWTYPNDDMDLHLLRPGGSFGTDGDCYFDNCVGGGPDWGVLGETSDDPSLDIDDIHGTGPENINIPMPHEGLFTVAVHDYQWSTPDYQSANPVTVNVFLGGQLVWTDTRDIAGENTYTTFATIDWPSGVVTTTEEE